jgi:hypothetical protein
MATDVEAVWTALLDRLSQESVGFKTVIRGYRLQYAIEQLPALELVEKDESPTMDEDGLPPRLTLTGTLGILARAKGDEPPMSRLNALIRSVREALERKDEDDPASNRHWTDLGIPGLVLTVGRVEKTLGEASGEAWAKIEVEMQTL